MDDITAISSCFESKNLTTFIRKQLLLESNDSLDKSIISNGERVKDSNCAKYLGVKIDNNVTF